MSGRFSGKTVLVAGGTGGLGRAVALAFLAEDAHVVVTFRKQSEFDLMAVPPSWRATVPMSPMKIW